MADCTHKDKDNCGCNSSPLTTSTNYNYGAENCPDGEQCEELYNALCVTYTGDDITCDGTVLWSSGERLTDFLGNFVGYFCNLAHPNITAQNVGLGEGQVYQSKDDINNIFFFRTIKAGTGVTITQSADEILIDAPGSVDYISVVAPNLTTNSLDFTGVGNAFSGSVDLSGIVNNLLVNIYNSDGIITDPLRTVDVNTGLLQFINGETNFIGDTADSSANSILARNSDNTYDLRFQNSGLFKTGLTDLSNYFEYRNQTAKIFTNTGLVSSLSLDRNGEVLLLASRDTGATANGAGIMSTGRLSFRTNLGKANGATINTSSDNNGKIVASLREDGEMWVGYGSAIGFSQIDAWWSSTFDASFSPKFKLGKLGISSGTGDQHDSYSLVWVNDIWDGLARQGLETSIFSRAAGLSDENTELVLTSPFDSSTNYERIIVENKGATIVKGIDSLRGTYSLVNTNIADREILSTTNAGRVLVNVPLAVSHNDANDALVEVRSDDFYNSMFELKSFHASGAAGLDTPIMKVSKTPQIFFNTDQQRQNPAFDGEIVMYVSSNGRVRSRGGQNIGFDIYGETSQHKFEMISSAGQLRIGSFITSNANSPEGTSDAQITIGRRSDTDAGLTALANDQNRGNKMYFFAGNNGYFKLGPNIEHVTVTEYGAVTSDSLELQFQSESTNGVDQRFLNTLSYIKNVSTSTTGSDNYLDITGGIHINKNSSNVIQTVEILAALKLTNQTLGAAGAGAITNLPINIDGVDYTIELKTV